MDPLGEILDVQREPAEYEVVDILAAKPGARATDVYSRAAP